MLTWLKACCPSSNSCSCSFTCPKNVWMFECLNMGPLVSWLLLKVNVFDYGHQNRTSHVWFSLWWEERKKKKHFPRYFIILIVNAFQYNEMRSSLFYSKVPGGKKVFLILWFPQNHLCIANLFSYEGTFTNYVSAGRGGGGWANADIGW